MNARFTTSLLLLTAFAAGCDRIPFLGGGSDTAQADSAAQDTMAAPAPAGADAAMDAVEDTSGPSAPATAQQQAQPPERQAPRPTPQAARPVAQADEVPWTPERTGTVSPGMTSEDVRGVWGDPVVERSSGEWTFMYYRNGCERTCGTFDVVFLQGGQVVDAIVRGMGHDYAGVSSSPADRPASFTPPSDNMQPDTLRIRG
jgi:hypothetical protein